VKWLKESSQQPTKPISPELSGTPMARASDSNVFLAVLRDKTFQAREIRRVMMLAMFYLVTTTVLLGIFYHQMLGNLVAGSAPMLFASEDMALVDEAIPSMTTLLGRWFIAMLIINVIVTVTLSVYIIRRLGHPLMAIRRALREVGNGNLDVRLRESDTSEFGELTAELRSALAVIRHHIGEAKSSLDTLESNAAPAANDSDDSFHRIRQALDYFQVDSANSLFDDDDDDETNAA